MKTIVSVTPESVDADSRTYKISASFARFGYQSIVVEGRPSDVNRSALPFELRSVTTLRRVSNHDGAIRGTRASLLKRLPEGLKFPGRMVRALVNYTQAYGIQTARILPPASLYYLHAPYQFPGLYPVARRYHVPIIYDAHDYFPMVDETPFLGWIESRCILSSDSVVTVSRGIAGLLSARYGCDPIVLRNAHDQRLEKNPEQGLRDRLGLGPDQFLLVCVGQAKSGGHITGTLEALTALPSTVHLAFVGKNTSPYRTQAISLGLEGRVHTVAPVKPEEVVPFIRSADAAIIPYYPLCLNYEYLLPNGFFQAISASLPLLYSPLTEIRSVAEQYRLGIPIDPFSAESIRSAVLSLLNDPERLHGYRAAAITAAEELSWEKEEEILKALILKTLPVENIRE